VENKDTEYIETLIKKFNVLISLILDMSGDKASSVTDKVKKLSDYGLKPAEIGEILGKKANYISAVINSLNKSKRKA
jgi:ATP-dependent RNA circularization protein (DNA/RNA ligase family)